MLPPPFLDTPAAAAAAAMSRLPNAGAARVSATIVCDVRKYGAKGDGVVLDTAAVQAAADECTSLGRMGTLHTTLLFSAARNSSSPPAVFLIGSINVHAASNMTVLVPAGVTILGSTNHSEYSASLCGLALICVENATNLEISGGGIIDGNGAAGWYSGTADGPMQLVVHRGSNVTIDQLSFLNSGSFHLFLCNVTNLTVANVIVKSPISSRNTDGIDPIDCTNVIIRNATVEAGDNAIALKGRTSNVLIENCNLRRKMLAFGSSSFVSNVTVRNSLIGWGLYIKSHPYKPTLNENILLENVRLASQNLSATYAPCAIGVNMLYTIPPYNGRRCKHYPCSPFENIARDGASHKHKASSSTTALAGDIIGKGGAAPVASPHSRYGLWNLTIRNLTSETPVVCAGDFRGLNASSPISDITLEDVHLKALVYGFSCNQWMLGGGDGHQLANVSVEAPQQAAPCWGPGG